MSERKTLHVKQRHETPFGSPRVVVAGDCLACKRPLPNGRVFFCEECSRANEKARRGTP